MEPKTKAIIAHLTIVGWAIAFVLNQRENDYYTTFYIRQTLAIVLAGMLVPAITGVFFLGGLFGMVVFVYWLISLINCINGKMEPVPFVGQYFQDWFRSV